MSIAIIGQQRYDFQDLVCVWLILLLSRRLPVKLYAEEGSEDARLLLGERDAIVDVQVKGSVQPLTLSELASVLNHYPARADRDFVLESLVNDKGRSFLLVATGRADDAVLPHVHNPEAWPITGTPMLLRDAEARVAEVKRTAQSKTSTALEERRRINTDKFANSVAIAEVCDVGSRLSIFERLDTPSVREWCVRLLVDLNVPRDRTASVMHFLIEAVKKGKGINNNIAERIAAIIAPERRRQWLPDAYVHRGDEGYL
jgi:hypothetical protein